MDLADYIMKAGPFTAPLCLAMLIAVTWVIKQWMAERAEVTRLLVDRAGYMEQGAKDYAEYGEVMRATIVANTNAVATFNAQAEVVLAR